jgi:hypothetical protein
MTEITEVLEKLRSEITHNTYYDEDAIYYNNFTPQAEKILAEWRDEVRREQIEIDAKICESKSEEYASLGISFTTACGVCKEAILNSLKTKGD